MFYDRLSMGSDCVNVFLQISSAGLSGEPHVQIDGPESVADSVIDQTNDGDFIVSYTPTEVGVFDVRITWDGSEIAGNFGALLKIRKAGLSTSVFQLLSPSQRSESLTPLRVSL